MNDDDKAIKTKLNLETSQMAWKELLRHFASGIVVAVSGELDLIEVAYQMSKDNREQVEKWLTEQSLAKVTDLQAKAWLDSDATLWAVVVKPWILVQLRTNAAPSIEQAGEYLH